MQLEAAQRAISRLDAMTDHLDKLEGEMSIVSDLMDNFPLPLIVSDGEQWVFVSASFAQELGWSRSDMEAWPYSWFVHPEDRSATQAEMQRVLRDHNMGSIVNRFRCKNGSYKKVLWRWNAPASRDSLIWMVAQVQE